MARTPPPGPDSSSDSGRARPPALTSPAQAVRWAGPFIERRAHEPLSSEAAEELRHRLESGYETLSSENRVDEYSAFVGHYVDRLTSRMYSGQADPTRGHTGDGGGYVGAGPIRTGSGDGDGGGDDGVGDVGRGSDPVVRSMRAICPMWPFC